jgi:cytosine/creatinine deaminase
LNLLHHFFGSFIILFMQVHANTFAKIAHCSSFMVASYNLKTVSGSDYPRMLEIAIAEARKGLVEGGIPIGAAIFEENGKLLGTGHNRRVQNGDPSLHAETDAFRNAGRQRTYRKLIMVTTLAPCWYCSGLVRQFGFGMVVVGESRNFQGGVEWLRSLGVSIIDLDSEECASMLAEYIRLYPEIWNEDIGRE